MAKAVEMPEIVFRVGQFIPCWAADTWTRRGFWFRPRDMVAATGTCRLWRTTLLPLLWIAYDQDAMRVWRVPAEVLQAQSRNFRYVTLQLPWPGTRSLQSTQLSALDITTPVLLLNMNLLHANPQLSKLTLRFRDKVTYKDIQPALNSLSRLTILRLCAFSLDGSDELGGFLNNNPGLKELELVSVDGAAGFQGCQPMLNLTVVRLDLFWENNLDLMELFRLCPRLESLALIPFDAPSELQDTLRSHCPKLKSVEYLDDIDFLFDPLTEVEAVSWIKLPSQPAAVDIPLVLFTNKVYQAFICQAACLENIKLDFRERSRDNALYTCKLVGLCPKLRHIQVTHYHDNDLPRCLDPSLEWFNTLQKHPTLNSIKILGFVLDWQPGNKDGTYEDGWEDSDLDEDDSEGGSDQDDENLQLSDQSLSDGDSADEADQGEGDFEDGIYLEDPKHSGGGSNPGSADHSEQSQNKLSNQDDDLSKSKRRESTAGHQSVYATVDKAKVPHSHPAEDEAFIESIASRGWTFEEDQDIGNRTHLDYFISRGARFLRNQIFQGLKDSPRLNNITVGGFVYVKKRAGYPLVEKNIHESSDTLPSYYSSP